MAQIESKSNTTEKAKLSKAYERFPELLQLEADLAAFELEAREYDRIPELILEHAQTIKYELNRRKRELARPVL